MKPIRTAECNSVFKGDGADVEDIHAQVDQVIANASFDGALRVGIFWDFTDEERERIHNGENLRVDMLHGVSPHWVDVVDAPEVFDGEEADRGTRPNPEP